MIRYGKANQGIHRTLVLMLELAYIRVLQPFARIQQARMQMQLGGYTDL